RQLDERVVRGHAPIVVEADDGAVMIREILRGVLLEIAFGRNLAIAESEEQVAVLVEDNLSAVVAAPLRYGLEQLLDARQPIVLEASADERGRGILAAKRLRITQVEPLVVREVRVRRHLQQPALAL